MDLSEAPQAALSQVGKPYQWKLTADKLFDASELTRWAYAQAGVTLPATANARGTLDRRSPNRHWQRRKNGERSFSEVTCCFLPKLFGNVNHVALYLGNDEMVDASSATASVSVVNVPWASILAKFTGATRPLVSQAANSSTVTATSGQQGPWQWPLKPPLRKTSPFGMRFHPIRKEWRMHNGTDFGVATGTPVFAAHSGTVTFTGYQEAGGNVVIVDHGGGNSVSSPERSRRKLEPRLQRGNSWRFPAILAGVLARTFTSL